ncbi:MAG: ribose 5-phosphate isomerase B [Phycisphaerae bacterium]|nr:ribose 5-phosphate isomerase B [Phycisphaerae bacterium]
MKIAVACDHRGVSAMHRVVMLLGNQGHEILRFGPTDNGQMFDYPDAGYPASRAVSEGKAERAILFCGSGVGMSIVANKVRGVRAALCHDELTAEISRRHNNANVLCLSADLLGESLIERIITAWLGTPYDAGRHERRNAKIAEYEELEAKNNAHNPN